MKILLFIFVVLFSISVQAQETELKFPEEFLGEWEGLSDTSSAKLIITQNQIKWDGERYFPALADITFIKVADKKTFSSIKYLDDDNLSDIYMINTYIQKYIVL